MNATHSHTSITSAPAAVHRHVQPVVREIPSLRRRAASLAHHSSDALAAARDTPPPARGPAVRA
jgi:hypothetical protein